MLRISFNWEEDEVVSYEELMEILMSLGADDISDEKIEVEEDKVERPRK